MSGPGAPPPPGSITTEHRYEFDLGRQAIWALISDVEAYREWWTWLRRFEADGLVAGAEWRCVVQPPLPYAVRFRVRLTHVAAPEEIRAHIDGDVVGTATLTLEEQPGGCVARLASSLAPGNAKLRLVSRLASPVARYGHDWVLDAGARQFVARAVAPVAGEDRGR